MKRKIFDHIELLFDGLINLITSLFDSLPMPWFFVFILISSIFYLMGYRTKGFIKTLSLNFFFSFIIIAVLELGMGLYSKLLDNSQLPNSKIEGTYNQNYFLADKELGYVPTPNKSFTSLKIGSSGQTIYNATYSIDSLRSRLTPDATSDRYIIFLGCSFTFGEGVNDAETFPSYVQALSNNKYKTLNYGFHGYGPHQMLRRLETRQDISNLQSKNIQNFIYLALPDHIARSAGKVPWDNDGPKYQIIEKKLKYVGPMKTRFQKFYKNIFLKSIIYKTINDYFQPRLRTSSVENEVDQERFVSIVSESNKILKQNYGSNLIVILWWVGASEDLWNTVTLESYQLIKSRLQSEGIEVYDLFDIFPRSTPADQLVIAGDGHPTPDTNKKIAQFILEKIVKK